MQDLGKIEKEALIKIGNAVNLRELEEIRVFYLGRKRGELTKISSELPKLSTEDKRKYGSLFNSLKHRLESAVEEKTKILPEKLPIEKTSRVPEKSEAKIEVYSTLPFDPTAPVVAKKSGHHHPLTLIVEEVKEIFHYLGFSCVDGPEVELDLYNFQKLLIGKDHPARDVQQTYYINDELLLRTHTSPMQIRYMEDHMPPIRIISPGRTYRRDMPDATHLPNFLQIEGLLVDTRATLTDLLGTLDFFVKRMFGDESKVRFYSHHFPYTEPSVEVELYHEKAGWIEILGAGMVHPDVLRNGGIDPDKYRGWAFGMGPDRLAMLKYGIDDIRLLYSGDLRFLEQF